MSSSRIYVPNKAILVTSGGSFIAERASDYPFSNFQSSGRLESMFSTKLGNHTFFLNYIFKFSIDEIQWAQIRARDRLNIDTSDFTEEMRFVKIKTCPLIINRCASKKDSTGSYIYHKI